MVTINLEILLTLISIIAAIIAIAGYYHQRRASIVAEGKSAAKIEALLGKVETQERKLLDLEKKAHCSDMDMAEVRADLKYLVSAVKEIRERIDEIAPPTVKV